MLSWWDRSDFALKPSPGSNKHLCLRPGGYSLPHPLLAALGGEGEDGVVLITAAVWRWCSGSVETTTRAAVHKRWIQAKYLPCQAIGLAAFIFQSIFCASDQLRIAIQAVYVVFVPLGRVHRGQVRSSPKLLPQIQWRRPGVEFSVASSKSTTQLSTSYAFVISIAG